ncbi:MAG: hypothetical protein JWR38_4759 [Mucilaginibacter sp.]|nr:hypothetical protein [Mucilaginibacter sp.]
MPDLDFVIFKRTGIDPLHINGHIDHFLQADQVRHSASITDWFLMVPGF